MRTAPLSALSVASLALALPLIACGPPKQLEPCNIATESCQEDVYYALVRLRGDGYDPLADIPPISTLTVDQYRRQLEGSQTDPPPADDDDGGVPDEPNEPDEPDEPKVEPWDTALQLLGLVLPAVSSGQASIDNQVTHVAAFYASDTRSVTVIDRGNERDDKADTILLLHELVHALQDRELSADLTDGTTDGILAARALTEGEATFYEHLGRAEIEDISPFPLDWDGFYTRWLGGGRNNLPNERSPFYGVRWFIYPLGAHYLTDAWLAAGNAGVRHAYAEPRRYMAQFMAGYGASSGARTSRVRCDIKPPNTAYVRRGYDRFGALQVYAFLTGASVPDGEGWPLAFGWVDDLIAVYFEPEDEIVLLTWRIRFADEDAAARALELVQLNPAVRGQVRGRDLVLIGGNDEDVAADFRGALDCDGE
jgi:hypothetical protein